MVSAGSSGPTLRKDNFLPTPSPYQPTTESTSTGSRKEKELEKPALHQKILKQGMRKIRKSSSFPQLNQMRRIYLSNPGPQEHPKNAENTRRPEDKHQNVRSTAVNTSAS